MAVSELSYSNEVVWITASSVECYLPHVWWRKKGETNSTFLEVNGWKVRLLGGGKKTGVRFHPEEAFEEFEEGARMLREWLPKATLLNGAVTSQGREYSFALAVWEQGQLAADGVWPENATPFEIKAKVAEAPHQLSFAMHPQDLRVRLRLFETNGLAGAIATAFYKGSRADLSAEFGESWVPERAELKAPQLRLPAGLLKLDRHGDLEGAARAEWVSNRFTLSISAKAAPLHSAPEGTEPVEVRVEAGGSGEAIRIENLASSLPGLEAALSGPVELGSDGTVRSGQAELQLGADLARVPGLKVKGRMEAKVLLEPGSEIPFWRR